MVIQIFSKFRRRLDDEPFQWLVKVVLWVVCLFLLFMGLFKYAEDSTWEEALWQTWQTFTTVGYGNAPAETTLGRWVTMIISTLGIAFLGALFSAAFDYKIYLKDKKRLGLMRNPFEDGYVIFNFPGTSTALHLIEQLRIVEKNVGVCFVDSRLEELPTALTKLPKTHFLKGEMLDRSTYEESRVDDNKAVMIFPQEPSLPDSDAATKTIVDLVSKFIANENEKTRIIYVLVDPANAWMFEEVKATHVFSDMEILAMVQESQDPHSSELVENLLLNTEGANPKTFEPTKTVGWTWGELVQACIETSQKINTPCNPFALYQKGECNTCPKPDTLIEKGDILSIIAYNDFDWEKFESELPAKN